MADKDKPKKLRTEFQKCVDDMLDKGNSVFRMTEKEAFCEYTAGPEKGKKFYPEIKP